MISIHALREEGDCVMGYITIFTEKISIHALREEGDRKGPDRYEPHGDFYPRPPRGGRPAKWDAAGGKILNFYPRPPRGGRHAIYTK